MNVKDFKEQLAETLQELEDLGIEIRTSAFAPELAKDKEVLLAVGAAYLYLVRRLRDQFEIKPSWEGEVTNKVHK